MLMSVVQIHLSPPNLKARCVSVAGFFLVAISSIKKSNSSLCSNLWGVLSLETQQFLPFSVHGVDVIAKDNYGTGDLTLGNRVSQSQTVKICPARCSTVS